MNLVNEGVLPPDEMDDRDERREEQERARSRETFAEIERHYNRAKERHPYFCDKLFFHTFGEGGDTDYQTAREELAECREFIDFMIRHNRLSAYAVVRCEFYEAQEAYARGDTAAAVDECFDCIAVLLRTIDVLEGRQKLGREGGEA